MKIKYIYKVHWKKNLLSVKDYTAVVQTQQLFFPAQVTFSSPNTLPPPPPPNPSKNFVSSFACSSILFNSIPYLFRPLILPSIPCERDRPQTLSFLFNIEAGPNIIFSILLCPLQNLTPIPFQSISHTFPQRGYNFGWYVPMYRVASLTFLV